MGDQKRVWVSKHDQNFHFLQRLSTKCRFCRISKNRSLVIVVWIKVLNHCCLKHSSILLRASLCSVFNNQSNPSRPTAFANTCIGDGTWTSTVTIPPTAKTHFSTYSLLNYILSFFISFSNLLNGTSSLESGSGWEIRTTASIGVGVMGLLKWFSMSKQLVESKSHF